MTISHIGMSPPREKHSCLATYQACAVRTVDVPASTIVRFQITDATNLSVTSDPVTVLVRTPRSNVLNVLFYIYANLSRTLSRQASLP